MVALLDEAWLLFLLSVIVSLVLFPLVFVVSFAYGGLCKRYPSVPKVLWMLACVFASTLAVLVLVEIAAGSVLFQSAGALAS